MGFTHKNLRDIENVAPKFGMPAGMEARFPRRELGLETVGVGHLKLPPRVRVPFGHRHKEQEEIYVVIEGGGRIKLDDEIVELRKGDVLRIEPGTMRQVEAGPDGIEYVGFGAGDAEVAKSDAELEPGWWTDESSRVS